MSLCMARVAPEKMVSRNHPAIALIIGHLGGVMPNRILREGIVTSERVNSLNWEEEVFYRRLMSIVDDFGRYYAHPSLLLGALYALKLKYVGENDIENYLNAVEKAGLIKVYVVENKRYLEMVDFKQQVRAKDSKYPSPDEQTTNNENHLHSKCIAYDKQTKSFAHLDGDGDGDDSNGKNSFPSQETQSNNCPHQEIIDLYHEVLPSARRIRDWTPSRQSALRSRWREKKERQSLEWWRGFFDYIAKSDFLMGRVVNSGRNPFELSLDWILSPKNMVKIIEGAYENR